MARRAMGAGLQQYASDIPGHDWNESSVVTERLQRIIEMLPELPPDERDRFAAALQRILEQPAVTSDAVHPEVVAAFDEVMKGSTAVLDYLRDKELMAG